MGPLTIGKSKFNLEENMGRIFRNLGTVLVVVGALIMLVLMATQSPSNLKGKDLPGPCVRLGIALAQKFAEVVDAVTVKAAEGLEAVTKMATGEQGAALNFLRNEGKENYFLVSPACGDATTLAQRTYESNPPNTTSPVAAFAGVGLAIVGLILLTIGVLPKPGQSFIGHARP